MQLNCPSGIERELKFVKGFFFAGFVYPKPPNKLYLFYFEMKRRPLSQKITTENEKRQHSRPGLTIIRFLCQNLFSCWVNSDSFDSPNLLEIYIFNSICYAELEHHLYIFYLLLKRIISHQFTGDIILNFQKDPKI